MPNDPRHRDGYPARPHHPGPLPATARPNLTDAEGAPVATTEPDIVRYRDGQPTAIRTGVLLVDEVVIIHHEPRPDGSRQMPEVGIVIPAHASALGKAIAAFSAEARKTIGEAAPLRSMNGETLTDLAALQTQWDDTAATGVASEAEEAVLGECALASPIFDAFDGVVGAIAVVVPEAAWPVDATVREALRETARAISRELGAPAWPGPRAV